MTDESKPDDLPFFLTQNAGLCEAKPEDDLLHPESFKQVKDISATETQYFGFSIPKQKIHALCYMWHHPNLKMVTGGLYVGQGIKPTNIHCELTNYHFYMDDSALANDLHDYRLSNGYGVKILEPLKRFHLTYEDKLRQNAVDLTFEATLPVVMFGDGKHFEQPMKVDGTLLLRGKSYTVDCFTVRDRSWGKPRQEMNMNIPPMSWCVGSFSEDFAFNATIMDQASNNPLITANLALPHEQTLNGGWIYRQGKLGRIVEANKRVSRIPGSLEAIAVELQLKDEHHREFDLRGTLISSFPMHPGGLQFVRINHMRWECDNELGYGDVQEAFWNDYLNL